MDGSYCAVITVPWSKTHCAWSSGRILTELRYDAHCSLTALRTVLLPRRAAICTPYKMRYMNLFTRRCGQANAFLSLVQEDGFYVLISLYRALYMCQAVRPRSVMQSFWKSEISFRWSENIGDRVKIVLRFSGDLKSFSSLQSSVRFHDNLFWKKINNEIQWFLFAPMHGLLNFCFSYRKHCLIGLF